MGRPLEQWAQQADCHQLLHAAPPLGTCRYQVARHQRQRQQRFIALAAACCCFGGRPAALRAATDAACQQLAWAESSRQNLHLPPSFVAGRIEAQVGSHAGRPVHVP
jgi:hypothetical protein